MRPIVLRLALAAATAVLAPALPAAAQPSTAGAEAWALAFQYDEGWQQGARDEGRTVEGRVVASARKGSAYATASATPSSGQLRGSAYAGHWRDVGMSGATIAQYVSITNHTDARRWYEMEMYFHGLFFGQCQVSWRCGTSGPLAEASYNVTAWQVDAQGRKLREAGQARLGFGIWNFDGGMDPRSREIHYEHAANIDVLPGTSRYLVEVALSFQATSGYNVVAEQTATIYAARQDGLTMTPEGEFLAQQARPDWATTSAPEPASLALVGSGLLALAGAAARRRRGRAAERSGGVLAGGRRCHVACSYAWARRISRASSHGRPKSWSPDGSVPRVWPIGTVIAGKPVLGANSWLLSPCGVLRSPMSRGGLLHVG